MGAYIYRVAGKRQMVLFNGVFVEADKGEFLLKPYYAEWERACDKNYRVSRPKKDRYMAYCGRGVGNWSDETVVEYRKILRANKARKKVRIVTYDWRDGASVWVFDKPVNMFWDTKDANYVLVQLKDGWTIKPIE